MIHIDDTKPQTIVDLLEQVDEAGEQILTWRGKQYVVSKQHGDERASKESNRIVEIIRNGPDWDDLEFERNRAPARQVRF